MENNVLMALSDSVSSKKALEYILRHGIVPKDSHLTLLHVFRKPTAGDALMGEKFMQQQPERFQKLLADVKKTLVENGYDSRRIHINLATTPYSTITDGIIDQFGKEPYTMVVLGRKRMSKAEEFVLGDVGVKLVRALEGVAILVIKA